eukprot:3472776-Alexandrium_andersonii.AAC.1
MFSRASVQPHSPPALVPAPEPPIVHTAAHLLDDGAAAAAAARGVADVLHEIARQASAAMDRPQDIIVTPSPVWKRTTPEDMSRSPVAE